MQSLSKSQGCSSQMKKNASKNSCGSLKDAEYPKQSWRWTTKLEVSWHEWTWRAVLALLCNCWVSMDTGLCFPMVCFPVFLNFSPVLVLSSPPSLPTKWETCQRTGTVTNTSFPYLRALGIVATYKWMDRLINGHCKLLAPWDPHPALQAAVCGASNRRPAPLANQLAYL